MKLPVAVLLVLMSLARVSHAGTDASSNEWMRADASAVECEARDPLLLTGPLFQIRVMEQPFPPNLVFSTNTPTMDLAQQNVTNCQLAVALASQATNARKFVYINLKTGQVKNDDGTFHLPNPRIAATNTLDPTSIYCNVYFTGSWTATGGNSIFEVWQGSNQIVNFVVGNEKKSTFNAIVGMNNRCNAAIMEADSLHEKVKITDSGVVPAQGFFAEGTSAN